MTISSTAAADYWENERLNKDLGWDNNGTTYNGNNYEAEYSNDDYSGSSNKSYYESASKNVRDAYNTVMDNDNGAYDNDNNYDGYYSDGDSMAR